MDGGASAPNHESVKMACKSYQMLTTELLDVLAKKGYIHSEVPELTDDNVEETLTQLIEDIK